MYVLIFFGILAGRCDSVVVREIRIRKVWVRGPGSTVGCDYSFFLIETLSITDQKFCLFVLSVLKMAATVYERDNCVSEVDLDPSRSENEHLWAAHGI